LRFLRQYLYYAFLSKRTARSKIIEIKVIIKIEKSLSPISISVITQVNKNIEEIALMIRAVFSINFDMYIICVKSIHNEIVCKNNSVRYTR